MQIPDRRAGTASANQPAAAPLPCDVVQSDVPGYGSEGDALLSAPVVAVVLVAAILHAGWNVAVRAGSDRRRESALLLGGGLVIGVVLLPFLPVPPPASWPYLLFSSVLNGVFFIMIAEAYAHGGVALAYPLMRGVAPMITLLGSWLLLGEALPVAG